VIGVGQVQHRIADQYHQLSVLAQKRAGERAVVGFDDDSFPYPLPELFLRGPELFAVAANNQSRFPLLLFLFLLWHFVLDRTLNTLSPQACSSRKLEKTRGDPEGKPL
jgi:hypothetical protein